MGEPVQKPILYDGRFAGLNREYSGEYSFGALGLGNGSARRGVPRGLRLGWTRRKRLGSARIWRAWTSVVVHLWHAWDARGLLCRIFRRRVWLTAVSDQADSCGSEFVLMSSTLWNDQNLFLTTLKIRIYPKTLLFSDERGSDTNCWWEEPLVVALKHSEGIKHTVLFQ